MDLNPEDVSDLVFVFVLAPSWSHGSKYLIQIRLRSERLVGSLVEPWI